MKLFIAAFIVLLFSFTVQAKEGAYSDSYNQCMDKADGVTVSMRHCYVDEIIVQDKRLNDNYRKFISTMSADVKKNFIDAQRQGVKFRDADCHAFASLEAGGTLSAVIADSCYLKMTAQRADDFSQ
ncbi:hypothetical protein EJP617_04460 [Erwinia sp. Ejp617]|nr:lysozyme inhibitor LprI family protein [Erwinia sp. Ejp617]ADP10127.1 hypothetical protein EJP617_04460 [Erwinia sp. Ejp617]